MLKDFKLNWSLRPLMALQPSKLKELCWREGINSCQIFCAMLEVLQLVTLNGWRIWIMWDQAECKENGKRKQKITWYRLYRRQLDWLWINLTRQCCWKEQLKEILCMQDLMRLCQLQRKKWSRHLWTEELT